MPNRRKPQLLDLVAVLDPGGEPDLETGDVGTVVELLPPDGAEVEFLDPAVPFRLDRERWGVQAPEARSFQTVEGGSMA